MKNRELLMLAKDYIYGMSIGGWYLSEKLDGMRAIWVPSTRGKLANSVPFANLNERMGTATGLWSRYGNVLPAPDWWLDRLPNLILDGELFIDRNKFQILMGITRAFVNPKDWEPVKFKVFDSPSPKELLREGRINNINFKKIFSGWDTLPDDWAKSNWFDDRISELIGKRIINEVVDIHVQYKLPLRDDLAAREVEMKLEQLIGVGAEGLILRHGSSIWEPIRSKMMLKVKQEKDAEAEVIGYIPGEGRLVGMVGSLIMKWGNVVFNLSGFTDDERRNGRELFKIGDIITFKYRELTDIGKPKEARYYRKFN